MFTFGRKLGGVVKGEFDICNQKTHSLRLNSRRISVALFSPEVLETL